MPSSRGLVDTSVFIARERRRPLGPTRLPDALGVSVVTLGELQAGVLAASDTGTRAQRLVTLQATSDMQLLPITEEVALEWARLRVQLADAGRRLNVNDSWIAATALAHDMPIVTQDDDFDVLSEFSRLVVLKV
jgi:predicted nucleic acid-binding protein